ncbi:MAG: DUF294 nucleotidyltransferase-like domain-containing protein [Bacteroidota bacterium]
MENVIPTRIASFLKAFPPFSLMEQSALLSLAEKTRVRYVQAQEFVFKQGEDPSEEIFVVREGAIHLVRDSETESVLVDECDEGDLFGIRPIMAEQPYATSALAAEESLLYVIPIDEIKLIMGDNSRIAWFFAQNFAAGVRNQFDDKNKGRIFWNQSTIQIDEPSLLEVQSINHSKDPVCCAPDTIVTEAARKMRDESVGSIIIVNAEKHPIGIMTDRDLRNKIVTGDFPSDVPISTIMSAPVITAPVQLSVADVQILMMKHRIHHLCLTADGTTASPVKGIISEHDLLVIQGNNPAILIRELRRSSSAKALRAIREKAESLLYKYLLREVSIDFISNIMTQVNDMVIVRAIELSEKRLKAAGEQVPEVKWCWMALGSEGREEQLLRTDQDNAIVFEDVAKSDYGTVKAYFLKLAQSVTNILNEVGFDYCPADMMASNPLWCISLEEWKTQFTKWMGSPAEQNLLYAMIFFDFRPIHGAFSLATELANHITGSMDSAPMFLNFLAREALQNPPPLTFFRNFMVERGGEHKNQFDIKSRAMRPLTDAARVLILQAKALKINNTFRRFDHLAELEPQNAELFEQASDAYEILVRYRAMQGLKNKDDGRYFNPEELSKMDRLNLRNSFQPIRKLHDLLRIRFRLQLMM